MQIYAVERSGQLKINDSTVLGQLLNLDKFYESNTRPIISCVIS